MAASLTVERILIVGVGSIGKRHLRLARAFFPQADIRVLRHKHTASLPEYSNGAFSDIEHAVQFRPQIAVIANPAPFHVAIAQRLAESGANLLVEKPISADEDGVVRLLETVSGKETVLQIGYNLRFLPSLQKFRELLCGKRVGQIWSVRCEIGQYLPSWRPDTDYRESVSARKELGGGALLELSHEIDYLRWIFGEIEQVSARISQQSNLEIDVEDTAHLVLGFAVRDDGRRLIGTLNMDFLRHDTTRLCTVIGEDGSLRWNGITGVIEIFEAGGKEWRELFRNQHQRDDSYLAEWREFLTSMELKKPTLASGEDGLQVLKVIEAARLSSRTGGQVQVAGSPECKKVSL